MNQPNQTSTTQNDKQEQDFILDMLRIWSEFKEKSEQNFNGVINSVGLFARRLYEIAVLWKGMFLAEWKTKIIRFAPWSEDAVIIESKDDITAWDWKRMETEQDKGKISNTTSSLLFEYLEKQWVPTHFIRKISDTEMLAQKCDMINVECVFRHRAMGSYVKRNAGKIKEWDVFETPVIEMFYKNDVFDNEWTCYTDPMIKTDENWVVLNDGKLVLLSPKTWEEINVAYATLPSFDWWKTKGKKLSEEEFKKNSQEISDNYETLRNQTVKVWNELKALYATLNLELDDWKVEFGKTKNGKIVLADMIDWDSTRTTKKYVVLWEDRNKYLVRPYSEKEFVEELWMSVDNEYKDLPVLGKWQEIKEVLVKKKFDKDAFRQWGDVKETIKNYAIFLWMLSEWLKRNSDIPLQTPETPEQFEAEWYNKETIIVINKEKKEFHLKVWYKKSQQDWQEFHELIVCDCISLFSYENTLEEATSALSEIIKTYTNNEKEENKQYSTNTKKIADFVKSLAYTIRLENWREKWLSMNWGFAITKNEKDQYTARIPWFENIDGLFGTWETEEWAIDNLIEVAKQEKYKEILTNSKINFFVSFDEITNPDDARLTEGDKGFWIDKVGIWKNHPSTYEFWGEKDPGEDTPLQKWYLKETSIETNKWTFKVLIKTLSDWYLEAYLEEDKNVRILAKEEKEGLTELIKTVNNPPENYLAMSPFLRDLHWIKATNEVSNGIWE